MMIDDEKKELEKTDEKVDVLSDVISQLPDNTRAALLNKKNKRVSTFVRAFVTGFVGNIHICNPEECPYTNCPLKEDGVAPEGYFCPMELISTDSNVSRLVDDLEPDNILDRIKIIDLVSTQLLQNRVMATIVKDGFTIDDPKAVLHVGKKGKGLEFIDTINRHPLFDVYLRLQTSKEKLYKLLEIKRAEEDNLIDAMYEEVGISGDDNDDGGDIDVNS